MKINEKANYFTKYLKKKQHQLKALSIKKEPYTQSTCIINSNSRSKKRKVCLNIQINDFDPNKQRLNHKKTISTPIHLITPKPTSHLVKYSFEDYNNIKDQSNKYLINYPYPSKLNRRNKHMETVEKKIHDLLNIIEVFEKENNLNYEPFKTFFYEKDSNTERYGNNMTDNNKYNSPPNSVRFNKTLNNLSLSSKESTHYLSKKISQQMNNNLNEAISKTNLDESSNTPYQYKSNSMKKAKHNYPKLIGLKQNMMEPKMTGGIISKVNPFTYQKSKEMINQSKLRKYSTCVQRTEENSYTNKYIKTQTKFRDKDKTESNINDLSSNLGLARNNCNNYHQHHHKSTNNSNSKSKHCPKAMNIKQFNVKEDQIFPSKSQCQSERNQRNKIKSIFF